MTEKLRLGIIGAGLKAADYAKSWVSLPEVQFMAVADVSAPARTRLARICGEAGRAPLREFDDYRGMLAQCREEIDAVYVSTPHAQHAGQAVAVVEAGYDLLLEKPMVTTIAEAEQLIAAQRRTRRLVVVAFNGALSSLVQDTRARAVAGEFGALVSVSATIWEGWSSQYKGHWKQQPELSGGGFMFDTGAHMMNTICLLTGEGFERVSAFMNHRGKAVDIVCAVAARLSSGALVTFHAAGDGPPGCTSHMTLFYTGAVVHIDAWGGWRELSIGGQAAVRETATIDDNPLKTFMKVRKGHQDNPSTVENGLRFAQLWDAIKASAARDGDPVGIAGSSAL